VRCLDHTRAANDRIAKLQIKLEQPNEFKLHYRRIAYATHFQTTSELKTKRPAKINSDGDNYYERTHLL
jgi:hypothetical protein